MRGDLSISMKKLSDLQKIFRNPSHYSENYKISVLKNYSGVKSPLYYKTLILALSDSSRMLRNYIINDIEKKGKNSTNFILPYLTTFSRLRRNSIARILSRWYPKFKRKKPYQIIQELPIQIRTKCIKKYMDQIVTEADSSKIFQAAISLELIGDFRAIAILRHTTSIVSVLNSQIKRHMSKHDDYSLFIIILYFCQNNRDENLKAEILNNYMPDLLRIANNYDFSDIFLFIFNELGLIGKIFYDVRFLSQNQKIKKTLTFSQGSLAYDTMIIVLSAEYPNSFQELETLRQKNSDADMVKKLDEISKSLLKKFRVTLKSGYSLVL